MKKIILFLFILLNCLLFSNEVHIDGIQVPVKLITLQKKAYINAIDAEKFGLIFFQNNGTSKISKSGLNLIFPHNRDTIIVNGTEFPLEGPVKQHQGETYFDFRLLVDIMGYQKSGSVYKLMNTRKENSNILVNRIVSLSPAVTEKLFALGAGDKLVGRTIYCTYPKKVKQVDSIGTMYEPKLELILARKPDIVIAETHFNPKTMEKLSDFGIRCIIKNSPNNLDSIYKNIRILGAQVDKVYESRALVYSLQQQVSRVSNLSKKQTKKPRVYFVLGSGKGEYTAGKGTFISEMIELAGGKNIADDVNGWSYNPEKIISNDPEIIFGTKKYVDIFVKKYSHVSAVKNGNYYYVDENLFVLPGPKALTQGLETMFDIFQGNSISPRGNL